MKIKTWIGMVLTIFGIVIIGGFFLAITGTVIYMFIVEKHWWALLFSLSVIAFLLGIFLIDEEDVN